MYLLKYTKEHEQLLKRVGYNSLEEVQNLSHDDKSKLIEEVLLPIKVYSDSDF